MKIRKKLTNLQLDLWEKELHLGKILFRLDPGGAHDL